MRLYLLRALIALVAVAVAGGIWLGLILVLKKSGIGPLQTAAVWVSHLSIFGWLLFGGLSIVLFLVFSKFTATWS